ncbi:MAG: hypothetical protein ACRYG2_14225 [Janthinobacterium lividum]
MDLIESSDRFQVSRERARDLLYERLALAEGIAAALDITEGQYVDRVASAGLRLLRAWIADHYKPGPGKPSTLWDGMDDMTVPPGSEEVMDRLRRGTYAADCLAMLYTADTQDESRHDRNELIAALDRWRRARPADPTACRRPVPDGPALYLPRVGQELSDELVFDDLGEAEAAAGSWNAALSDPSIGWPWSGQDVFVKDDPKGKSRWRLAWE